MLKIRGKKIWTLMLKFFGYLNLCPNIDFKVFKINSEFKTLKNTEFRQIIIASL